MKLIVAVYADWGIGKDGTQPVALSADRKFFRETTRGATVIVGRRTTEDFPGQKPLPGRKNIVLTRSGNEIPGFILCDSAENAVKMTENDENVFVIGGGSIYRQLLPYCDTAYITKLDLTPESDTFFPDLDADPAWKRSAVVLAGEENGVNYQMCRYERI
jgi:dihydrofolate reductase